MMDRRVRWTVVGFMALLVALGSAGPARAVNLVANPGFETGSFSSWTTVAASVGSNFGVNNVNPNTGTFDAFFTADSGSPSDMDSISQSINTVLGQKYEIDFFMKHALNSGGPNRFLAEWGATTLSDTVNAGAIPNYTLFSFIVTGTGSPTVLKFSSYNDGTGLFRLDDVFVEALPEPASLTLFGLGLVGLVGYRWRRRQSAGAK